ncbi:hypothetical protein ACTPEM_25740, partial [Clostridioides difficile]
VMGIMNVKSYVMGGLGIFGIPNYINPTTGDMKGVYATIIAIIAHILEVSFILTPLFNIPADITILFPVNNSVPVIITKLSAIAN